MPHNRSNFNNSHIVAKTTIKIKTMKKTPQFEHIKLITFDWDGTLFDSTTLIARCIQNAVVDVGGKKPSLALALHVIGLGLGQALAQAAPDVPIEKYPQLQNRYLHHYSQHANDLCLFEGTLQLLQALRLSGYQLAIATGKSRLGLDASLQHVALQNTFQSTRTAEETQNKPHPQMLLELMQELHVTPDTTLMVGDTTHDLGMAQHAGCAGIGVSFGAHQEINLWQCSPLAVVHSIAQLQTLLCVCDLVKSEAP